MKEYEVIHEIFNQCPGNKTRDQFIEEIEIEDVAKYRKQVIRHELIHAFLCESGLHENCKWHNEEMVDWLAIQAPKLQKIFKETEYI